MENVDIRVCSLGQSDLLSGVHVDVASVGVDVDDAHVDGAGMDGARVDGDGNRLGRDGAGMDGARLDGDGAAFSACMDVDVVCMGVDGARVDVDGTCLDGDGGAFSARRTSAHLDVDCTRLDLDVDGAITVGIMSPPKYLSIYCTCCSCEVVVILLIKNTMS